jgi:ABC-2 type transport system permease protein
MTTLVRVELLKLRTTRLTFGLLGTAIGLTVLFSILEASLAGTAGNAPLPTPAGLDAVITGGIWSLLFAAIAGVTMSSGEFRHATATATYLAEPARGRVLAAQGARVPVSAATIARYGAGHLIAGALLAAIGVCLGSLVRSQLAAVLGILLWSVVVESVIGGLFHPVQPYLPYTAATTLAGSTLGGAAFGPAHGVSSSASPLPFAAATALLAAVAIVTGWIAARTTVGRDVS